MTKIYAFEKGIDCKVIATLLVQNMQTLIKDPFSDPLDWREACEDWQNALNTLRHNIDAYAEQKAIDEEAERQAKLELKKQEEEEDAAF